MKRINILFSIIILGIVGLTSCQDQTANVTINPKAEDGSLTFHLNQTQYADWVYTLTDANASADMDALTCQQPDYGFTAAVTYYVQVGFDSLFQAGNYQVLPTSVNGEKVGMNTLEMDKAMVALYGGLLPDTIVAKDVYVRLQAFISNATPTPMDTVSTVKPLYSNIIKLRIMPYALPLFSYSVVTAIPYFIVGLGDGSWSNGGYGDVGKSLIPLGLVAGNKYNLSGNGEFVYTGYFLASQGFKLIRDPGAWAEQWGMNGTTYAHNDGNSGNITVPADGYYTITLNSISNMLTIEPANAPANAYSTIGLIGDFNNWGADVVMTPSLTANNHAWFTTYNLTAAGMNPDPSSAGVKFRANADWTNNWGSVDFPYGIASPGGKNVLYNAGNYIITFDDITGTYYFFKQ